MNLFSPVKKQLERMRRERLRRAERVVFGLRVRLRGSAARRAATLRVREEPRRLMISGSTVGPGDPQRARRSFFQPTDRLTSLDRRRRSGTSLLSQVRDEYFSRIGEV